ncbi:MAG: GWxTD domain-containing protein [Gemmatimonadaceae bacterium]|nr:GWxTD domain-containing protein [Gemmatimonadaceae bacterium]
MSQSIALLSLICGSAAGLAAQIPAPLRPTTDPVALRAEALAVAGDSTGAMAFLDSAMRAQPKNAAAWHQYGLLHWAMAASGRRGGYIGDARVLNLLRGADSALRLATKFAPDSAQYWVTLGRFNLQSDVASMHFAASRQMENALKAATRVNDSLFMAMGADEVGSAIWRRYELVTNRAMTTDGNHVQLAGPNNKWRRDRGADYVATFAKKIEPATGVADYLAGLERFRAAVAAGPTHLRYSRHLFMALAEGRRWPELLASATERATRSPFDFQARLAQGLALHRLGRDGPARAAFDTALVQMDESDRARLLRLTRILRPRPSAETVGGIGDSIAFTALSLGQRNAVESMYWLLNDPLSTTRENEYQLEFFSRVVYAEFRWSDEDLGVRGADTDRGDIYVRYGPPDVEITVPGKSSVQQYKDTAGNLQMSTNEDGGATLIWSYRLGYTFFFDMAAGFGTARVPVVDRQFVADVKNASPVSWNNLGLVSRVDSMDVRVARFRAPGDSADVVVAANVSLESLLRDVEIVDPEVSIDFRVYDAFARTNGAESTRASLNADSVTKTATRAWVRRIGKGINMVRVEAMQRDVGRAARATLRAEPDTTKGFGLSDVLLANARLHAPPANVTSWRMLGVEPSNGVVRSGARIGLAWEIYELAEQAQANTYRVSIAVERVKRVGAAALALRVLDGLGSVLRQGESGSDRLVLSFDRKVAASATQVEYIALDWLGESRGEYRLRIEVADINGQKKSARETSFTIR